MLQALHTEPRGMEELGSTTALEPEEVARVIYALALLGQVVPAREIAHHEPSVEKPPAKAEPAPSMLSAQGRVVIQPGNNLWNISRVIYGRGIEYTTIYEANKDQIRNPHWIYPGQIFMTPGTVPPEEIDPKRREPIAMDEKQTQ